jgi:hypothetical protein
MFAVSIMTFTRRLERDWRSGCRCRAAKKRNRGNDECCRPRHCARFYHFVIAVWRTKEAQLRLMKYWEIVADNLSKPGGLGAASATVDSRGRTIFVADAHRDNGERFIVTAGEKLTAFLELERVTRESFRFLNAE